MSSRMDRPIAEADFDRMCLHPLYREQAFTESPCVNVFSMARTYIPLKTSCQGFPGTFALWSGGRMDPSKSGRLTSRLQPATVLHHPCSLSQGDQSIHWHAFKSFNPAVGPAHFQVDSRMSSEPEVQAGIVTRIETALAQNALGLRFPAIAGKNPGTDRAPIGFNSLKFYLYPVLIPDEIVA